VVEGVVTGVAPKTNPGVAPKTNRRLDAVLFIAPAVALELLEGVVTGVAPKTNRRLDAVLFIAPAVALELLEGVVTGVAPKTNRRLGAVLFIALAVALALLESVAPKENAAVDPCAGAVLFIAPVVALELNGGGGGGVAAAVRRLPSDVFVSCDTGVSFLKRYLEASERSRAAGFWPESAASLLRSGRDSCYRCCSGIYARKQRMVLVSRCA
jgi:uncharacterized protein YjeT (DUF2065 family)